LKKVRLGIIGLGYIGKIHLRNSVKLANAKVVAVSDILPRTLKRAKNFGVKKTFTDYKTLLKDSDIDSVIISLPTHLHAQCVHDAAEAKKNIFLEKPIAGNVEDAKGILSIVKKNSVKLMIGYPLRFNTNFVHLKEQIDSGALGDVEVALASFIGSGPFMHRNQDYAPIPVPEWWFKKELTGGGVLIDLGSHMINLLRWYFGEISSIKCYFGHRFNMEFEDSALCLVRFKSGTRAQINVGWFSQQFQQKVELIGTVRHAIASTQVPNPILAALQMLTTGTTTFWRPHIAELEHFSNCILCDEEPSPSGTDGLKDLKIIERAYRAPRIDLS
jgi:predicted dehydrogenase